MVHIGPEATAKRLERLSVLLSLPEDQNLATRFLDRQFADTDFSDRYLQNSWSNLKAILLPILTETVIRCLSHADFTIEQVMLGKKPLSIYLCIPENRLKPLAPLIRLVLRSLITGLTTLHDTRKGEGCRPVLVLADEAGIAPVPGLPELAASVCGRGSPSGRTFKTSTSRKACMASTVPGR
jgi:hypothetical protein